MKRFTLALVLSLASHAQAAGLRTPFGEVIVRNLKIGQSYSMYTLVNLPLRVINTGGETTDLRIETIPTRPEEARPGYTPIPSLDWVKVEKSSFTLEPNREAVTDIRISIPNDPTLLGRRFQADIWSHTIGARSLLVGMRSQLLLHIDSTPPSEEELKKKFVNEKLANLDFTVMPVSALASDIPLGREVDLRKERKLAIKLINPNDQAINFRVRSIPVWESMMLPPEGYEAAENPQWLKPLKDVVKIEGSSIGETGLLLNVPADAKYKGRHLFFVVSFELLEQKIPTRFYYRLLVNTSESAQGGSK